MSHSVMTEAARVGGIVPIGGEAAARRVEMVEASAIGAHPQPARAVGLQRRNPCVAEPPAIRGIRREMDDLSSPPIEAIETAILRADPENPVAVF
jgi:hypothetical protein